MFNCKKLFKATDKTTEPNPVDGCIPGYVSISQLKLRSEKFYDDDNNRIS